jgi:hypothetical protein
MAGFAAGYGCFVHSGFAELHPVNALGETRDFVTGRALDGSYGFGMRHVADAESDMAVYACHRSMNRILHAGFVDKQRYVLPVPFHCKRAVAVARQAVLRGLAECGRSKEEKEKRE